MTNLQQEIKRLSHAQVTKMMTIVFFVITLYFAAKSADIEIEHFEDGSGRITYCLPFSLCTAD